MQQSFIKSGQFSLSSMLLSKLLHVNSHAAEIFFQSHFCQQTDLFVLLLHVKLRAYYSKLFPELKQKTGEFLLKSKLTREVKDCIVSGNWMQVKLDTIWITHNATIFAMTSVDIYIPHSKSVWREPKKRKKYRCRRGFLKGPEYILEFSNYCYLTETWLEQNILIVSEMYSGASTRIKARNRRVHLIKNWVFLTIKINVTPWSYPKLTLRRTYPSYICIEWTVAYDLFNN